MTPAQLGIQIEHAKRHLKAMPPGTMAAQDAMEQVVALEGRLAEAEKAPRPPAGLVVYTEEELQTPGWQSRRPELAQAIANGNAMKENPGRPGHYYNPAFSTPA